MLHSYSKRWFLCLQSASNSVKMFIIIYMCGIVSAFIVYFKQNAALRFFLSFSWLSHSPSRLKPERMGMGLHRFASQICRSAPPHSVGLNHRLLTRPLDAFAYADALAGSRPMPWSFDSNKKETIKVSFCCWRRAWDSNPTFAMAGTVENTGIQRLTKSSVCKSVCKKSPAGLFLYSFKMHDCDSLNCYVE